MDINQSYTLQELLQESSLKKLKEKYKDNSKIVSKDKSKILTDISKRYEYVYNKMSDTYTIINEKELILPTKIQALMDSNDIYKYLIPLIMKKAYSQPESKALVFTTSKYAEHLSFVNKHYNEVKQINTDKIHRKELANALDIKTQILYEYVNNTDDMIKYYISRSLSALKAYFTYQDNVQMVAVIKENPSNPDESYLDFSIANETQLALISEAKAQADNESGIKEPSQRAYNKEYNMILQKYLNQAGIVYTFQAYQIAPIKSNATKKVFNYFNQYTLEELTSKLNYTFLNMMNENAKDRKEKLENSGDCVDYYEYRLNEDYLTSYNFLGTITLLPEKGNEYSDKFNTIDKLYNEHIKDENLKIQLTTQIHS